MLIIETKELNISEELRKKVDMRTNHKEYGIPYNFNLFEDDYGYPLKMNWELRTEEQIIELKMMKRKRIFLKMY